MTITDVEGKQIGDLVAFNAHDVTEYLHTPFTRVIWGRIYPKGGDVFLSTLLNPVLEIVHDDVGQHDIVRALCNPARYLKQCTGLASLGSGRCRGSASGTALAFGRAR